MKNRTITVKGVDVSITTRNEQDYISLTDMVKKFGDESILYNWLRNRNTIEFLGIWEQLYNPDFKPIEFDRFRSEAGLNSFALSPKKWMDATGAIGIYAKSGRGGGTYAHRDIAFESGSWLSPEFKLYLIKEFQRLKDEESRADSLEWNFQRTLAKVNYKIHTDAIKEKLIPLQPGEREIVGQMLRTNEQFTLASETGLKEQRLEDYIVHALVDFDDIDYFTHADLLYDLAGQLVQHLLGYLSEDEARSVLDRDRRLIAREIHTQMMAHFWEQATSYEVQVSRGFTELKPCNYTATAGPVATAPGGFATSTPSMGITAHHFRETVVETSRIKQMLFGGFERCLYPLQKFDSDTERRFCIILERDALKWFKPAKGQFQIYYKLGTEQPEYVPDFVAETDSIIYMVETKARTDVNTQEVQAKADSAARWCKHASDHTAEVGAKPWKYLLLPHDEIAESKRLSDYLRFEVKR